MERRASVSSSARWVNPAGNPWHGRFGVVGKVASGRPENGSEQ